MNKALYGEVTHYDLSDNDCEANYRFFSSI